MITITFCKEKGELTLNGNIVAEGSAEELEVGDDATLVGMAFGPAKNSRTMQEMVEDDDLEIGELAMTLSLLHVMFPGGVNIGMHLSLSQQDVEPWLENLDTGLPLPDIGDFEMVIPSTPSQEDEEGE